MATFEKLTGIALTDKEAKKIVQEKKMLVTYSKIYRISWDAPSDSPCVRIVYSKTSRSGKGFVKRGMYQFLTYKEVNNLLGAEIFVEPW